MTHKLPGDDLMIQKIPDYPIYEFHCKFTKITKENGIEVKRETDSISSLYKMYKAELTENEININAMEWWNTLIKQDKYKNYDFLNACPTGKFVRKAPWCLTWFSHYTFDIGLTDAEYLDSFENYVYSSQDNQHELMGATDRWRWHGENDNREKPICRCEHCKKFKIIRIDH